MTVHVATIDELDVRTLYALLRLRVEVFVVEQQCPYPELDGRDLEPATQHLWVDEGGGEPVAYLRLLVEADGSSRIGRVVTAARARGSGHADALMRAALGRASRPVVLEAQAHLVGMYERFGFVATGAVYLDDGIPHVPMRAS